MVGYRKYGQEVVNPWQRAYDGMTYMVSSSKDASLEFVHIATMS